MTFPVLSTLGVAAQPCPKLSPSGCSIGLGCDLSKAMALRSSAAVTLFNPCDAPKLQCLGIPFISVDARVIDVDTGAELGVGEQGEIVVHGPQVFQGYWRRADATEQAFNIIDESVSCAQAILAIRTKTATSSLQIDSSE